MSQSLHYLSYYFPPTPSIASKRNDHIFRHFSPFFDTATLYTTRNNKAFQDVENIDTSHNQIWISTLDYRTIIRWLSGRKKENNLHYDETKKKKPWVRFLIKLNETLPFSIFLGEGGLVFIMVAVYRILKNMDSSVQHTVFTSYRPTADILVGYLIKRMRPSTKWIASFHDVPVLSHRPNSYFPALQHWFWRKFLRKADVVIGATEGVSNSLRDYGVQAKTMLNGIEIRIPDSGSNNQFTIAYTGSIYEGLMYPDVLFECVASLIAQGEIEAKHLKIIYAGKDSVYWKGAAAPYDHVCQCLDIRGLVTHEEALNIQLNANINYLMSWNDDHTHGVLTGKLFEYLGARNPIITVINGRKDAEFERLFEKYQCGKIFYTADDQFKTALKNHIADLYNLWLSGNFHQAYNSEVHLQGMSWEHNVHQCFKD